MKTAETEFLIIGSGFGAAAPALRLSEAGFNVLMIEKGKYIEPEKDLKQTQDPKYFLEYLKTVSGNNIGFTYAEAYGGGSAFYEMVSLRAPSAVFELKDKNGRRYWPAGISRKNMDPFYDIAEKMLNVEQIPADKIPKSGVAFSLLMKNLGYSCDRARYAVKDCVGSGYCVSGCIFGAKQSLHYNYLPQARANGMQIMCSTEAKNIIPVDNQNRYNYVNYSGSMPFRYKVRCMNLLENEPLEVKAKFIILGGGTVGTTKLLLSSQNYLPGLSWHTGKNIAFNGSVKAAGLLSEDFPEGDMFSGMSHPGMISYHFFGSRGITISSAKPLPLVLTSDARLTRKGKQSYWGKDYLELMKLYRKRMIVLYALGLTEPSAEIRYNGNNSFSAYLRMNEKLRTYDKEAKDLLNSIFTRNSCEALDIKEVSSEGEPKDDIYFSTTHMIGSCRMADSKKFGVIDSNGEVFGYQGLFISDGASVPTSLAVNSALTILANAERISSSLVKRLLSPDFESVKL
jgi:enediyne biosynthesis protein E9